MPQFSSISGDYPASRPDPSPSFFREQLLDRRARLAAVPGAGEREDFRTFTLFLYTDGLSEATNGDGESYGTERVEVMARQLNGGPSGTALESCLADLTLFQGGAAREDDLTMMMVRRSS